MKRKYYFVIFFLVLAMFLSGCSGGVVTPATDEAKIKSVIKKGAVVAGAAALAAGAYVKKDSIKDCVKKAVSYVVPSQSEIDEKKEETELKDVLELRDADIPHIFLSETDIDQK